MQKHIQYVGQQIDRLNETRGGYNIPQEYSLEWLMFAIADGDVFTLEHIGQNYSTLETLKLMYFKQVKTLKELEGIKKR